MITAIMAATEDGVIGCSGGNGIPWDHPEELDHYRKTTAGSVIVMGRKTFECLPPHAFNNKTAIVLSKTFSAAAGVESARTPERTLTRAFAVAGGRPIYVIGGAEAIRAYLDNDLIDRFLLSRIHGDYRGDVRMDLSPLNKWHERIVRRASGFTICELTRARQPSRTL